MDIFRVCRICSQDDSSTECISLFENDGRLQSHFELCTGVSLYEDRQKPALICIRCVDRLERAYALRISARTVEIALQKKPTSDIMDPKKAKSKIMKPGMTLTKKKKTSPKANQFKRNRWNVGLSAKLEKIRQSLSPQSLNQFTSLQTVPFLRRNLRKYGVQVNYKKEEEQITPQTQSLVIPAKAKRVYRKKQKAQETVVIKRKYTKKNKPLGIKTYAAISKRNNQKIYIPTPTSTPSPMLNTAADNEINILLENFKSEADTQMLMESIEKPSLLFSSVDSTVPIDMELDFDLSGPSSSMQQKPKHNYIDEPKAYSKAYNNKSFFCPLCQCYGTGSAVIHRAQNH